MVEGFTQEHQRIYLVCYTHSAFSVLFFFVLCSFVCYFHYVVLFLPEEGVFFVVWMFLLFQSAAGVLFLAMKHIWGLLPLPFLFMSPLHRWQAGRSFAPRNASLLLEAGDEKLFGGIVACLLRLDQDLSYECRKKTPLSSSELRAFFLRREPLSAPLIQPFLYRTWHQLPRCP